MKAFAISTFLSALVAFSAPALASQRYDFSLKGIKLGQEKDQLDTVASFQCGPADNAPGADESCSATTTFGHYPALLTVSLVGGRVRSVIVVYKNPDHATFFTDVSTAASLKYGDPFSASERPDGTLLTWIGGAQRYLILHGTSSGGVIMSLTTIRKASTVEQDI